MSRHDMDPTAFRPTDWEAAERVIRRAEIRSDVRKWSRRVAPFLVVGAVLAGGQIGLIPWPAQDAATTATATAPATAPASGHAVEGERTAAVPAEAPAATDAAVPDAGAERSSGVHVGQPCSAAGAVAAVTRAGNASRTAPAARRAGGSSGDSSASADGFAVPEAVPSSAIEASPRKGDLLQGLVPRGLSRNQARPVGRFNWQDTPAAAESGPKWSPRLAFSPLDASWSMGLERAVAGGRVAPQSGLRVWGEAGWDRARMTAAAREDVGVFSYATVDHVASSRDALFAAAGCAVERTLGNDVAVAVGVQAGYVLARRVTVRTTEPAGGVETVSGWGQLEGVSRRLAGPVLRVHCDRWEHLRVGAEVGYRMAVPETGSFASFETSGPVTVRLIFVHRP